jgi:hypothetical protein
MPTRLCFSVSWELRVPEENGRVIVAAGRKAPVRYPRGLLRLAAALTQLVSGIQVSRSVWLPLLKGPPPSR